MANAIFNFHFFEPFPKETLKTKQRVRVIIGVIMIISSFGYHRVKNGADETTPKCSEADKNCTGYTFQEGVTFSTAKIIKLQF